MPIVAYVLRRPYTVAAALILICLLGMLSSKLFDRGLTEPPNVIDAQRQEYDLEAQYVAAHQNAAGQFVSLYKALGGGWEAYQAFPPLHQPLPAVMAGFTGLTNSHDLQ